MFTLHFEEKISPNPHRGEELVHFLHSQYFCQTSSFTVV